MGRLPGAATVCVRQCGCNFSGMSFSSLLEPLPLGIGLGLFVGKQIGVFDAAFLMIKTGLAKCPKGRTGGMLHGISLLYRIGFTMILFVGGLAFDDAAHATAIRLGVLAESLAAGTLGYFVLKFAIAAPKETQKARRGNLLTLGGNLSRHLRENALNRPHCG